jgi:hypothetical protein
MSEERILNEQQLPDKPDIPDASSPEQTLKVEEIPSVEEVGSNAESKITEEDMEVHHHAHHHAKKTWKTYLFDFFMLFLAVFCGSLAEYQLEHKIEADREKVFIRSLIDDLKSDTLSLFYLEMEVKQRIEDYNKLAYQLASFGTETDKYELTLENAKWRGSYRISSLSDRTISQLKNSGGVTSYT